MPSEESTLHPRAIYVCPGDPYNSPRGGQTAFARQALNALGGDFALVAPDELGACPRGEWFLDSWQGAPIWRFNIGSYAPRNKSRRPFIPRRIVFRHLISKYLPKIREIPTRNLFCDSPELLGVLRRYEWESVCYRFAGLNNPVGASRYPKLRFLAPAFHRVMIRNLTALSPECALASADQAAIDEFTRQNPEFCAKVPLALFPTRFDPATYFPSDPVPLRRALGWENASPRLVMVGRLCWVKGWRLALESVARLKERYPRISLRFVGDGEDRRKIEESARELGLEENVVVDGFLAPEEVRRRLVAADLFLSASFCEGWSLAFAEALACGKTCVSTLISGARDMVRSGCNGYVVEGRSPDEYARAIERALALASRPSSAEFSLGLSARYSLNTLAQDWRSLWSALRS